MAFVTFLITSLLLLALLAAVFYVSASRLAGSATLIVGAIAAAFISPWTLLIGLPIIAVAVILCVEGLRKKMITKPVYGILSNAMPPMSDTEREALDAGTSWWEKELFQGKPDWTQFEAFKLPVLSEEEQAFIDNEVETLCGMVDEWTIHHELKDLPTEAWEYIKDKGFLSLIIPKEFGGLDFSRYAQSRIMSKIASRSATTAVTAMVPNSLGPGELLMHYGTEEQKNHWLPRLAKGIEIPCFGLTGPEAGSDAGSIPDTGVVCMGTYEGKEVLGMRLNFAKRWITLAPVATVVGLAFKLHDPDHLLNITDDNGAPKADIGITCALVPADVEGIEIGRRHNPGSPFMNGPINGKDVFVPVDFIIGGPKNAGIGWRMLMECLGVGRGISLPAMATASGEMAYRGVGAFSAIRRQFKIEIGKFEGVQMAASDIASKTYTLEAFRHMVTYGLDQGGTPSVMTAMAKYYATEMMRDVLDHAMDIVGGRGIQHGPRNFLALPHQSVPVAITVEGANILTRSLMIFGQGAMRCHPYLFDELQTLQAEDQKQGLDDFDEIFFKHMAYTFNRAVVTLVNSVTGGHFTPAPNTATEFTKPYYKTINRFSSAFALTADMALGILAGDLKRKEMLSGRLADIHSNLLMATSVLYYYEQGEQTQVDRSHASLALQDLLQAAQSAFDSFYANFPARLPARLVQLMAFPFGAAVKPARDDLRVEVATQMMQDNPFRQQLAKFVYNTQDAEDAVGRVESTYQMLLEIEPLWSEFRKKQLSGSYAGLDLEQNFSDAISAGDFTEAQIEKIKTYNAKRYDALLTDAFDKDLLHADVRSPYSKVVMSKSAPADHGYQHPSDATDASGQSSEEKTEQTMD